MTEPTRPELVTQAEKAGVIVNDDMTKADIEAAITRKLAEPGTPVHPHVAPSSTPAPEPEVAPDGESGEGTYFADDEFSTQDMIGAPGLLRDHVPAEFHHALDSNTVRVALARSDAERSFWTAEDAARALTDLLSQPVE